MSIEPNQNGTVKNTFDAFNGIEKELTAQGLFSLAFWFDNAHQTEAALKHYQLAIDADPELAEAHYNMGVIQKDLRNRTKAVYHFQKAIQLKPEIAESYSALSMVRYEEYRYDEALKLLQRALSIRPHFGEAHYHMGIIFQEMGEHQRGLNCFQKAIACNPDLVAAHWRHLLSLPMVYDTAEQINVLRQRFTRNLDSLIQSIKLNTPLQIQRALQGVGTATNFYLQYQGRNDVELQKKYGQLVHDVMSAVYPQWRRPPSVPPPKPGEALKIGYVSTFMCRHTIGTFLSGWVENHDPSSFRIHCYHMGQKTDSMTSHFKENSHQFHHFPGDVAAAAKQIASDKLHLLVFSDIGMNMETLQLAALKLAPIQCKGWGHPVTTGLPTIDYYLSSDLMEPENAQQYYSETLVRLPNLALCYQSPQMPSKPMNRKVLGIADNRFIFLSPQSIYKYLPQHDNIYPIIAKGAPNAIFVFISHQNLQATQRFQNRLRAVFDLFDLDANHYCKFMPRLSTEKFLSLNMASNALLDTLEWSGGKTTLEAISCGLPVVTLPGRFMRGRHAYAMLKMINVYDTIAQDRSQYCRIAIRLAADKVYHQSVKKRIRENKHMLYNDRLFITELEKFYFSISRHPRRSAVINDRKATASMIAKNDGASVPTIE